MNTRNFTSRPLAEAYVAKHFPQAHPNLSSDRTDFYAAGKRVAYICLYEAPNTWRARATVAALPPPTTLPVTAALLGDLAGIRDATNSAAAHAACLEAQKGFGPTQAEFDALLAVLPRPISHVQKWVMTS
jgi:hypothetical protein